MSEIKVLDGFFVVDRERFFEIINSRQILDKLEVNTHLLGFIVFIQF